MYTLLSSKSEQERRFLAALVNKVCCLFSYYLSLVYAFMKISVLAPCVYSEFFGLFVIPAR